MSEPKENLRDIRAMILAAGFGTRMQKGGEDKPKPLVELLGQPLIKYPIALLRKAGFDEVVINLHHRADEIEGKIGDGRELGIKINWLREPEILGTGGGVKNANRIYPARKWLTINADTVIDLELKNFLYFHRRYNPIATMAVCKPQENFNPVFTDSLGRVRKIGNFPEKITEEVTISRASFCGVQIVSSAMLDHLPEGFSKMIEHGYFKALEKNQTMLAYSFNGLWLTFDHPQAIARAQAKYSDRLAKMLA